MTLGATHRLAYFDTADGNRFPTTPQLRIENHPAGLLTNAKLADMAQASIKGRASGAGTGVPTDLTAAQVRTILALDTVTYGPSDVVASGGSPALSTLATTLVPVWLLDAAAGEAVGCVTGAEAFSGWTTATTTFLWAPSDAAAGDVRWFVQAGDIPAGSVPAADVTTFVVGAASGTTNQVVSTTTAAWTLPATPMYIRFGRDGGSGLDTYAADAKLLAAIITKAT